jgi:F-type H+-transporting ATPase subunit gamma
MPSLIDIRRRIRSVKNMQQITKAMKMVSAAKLRRAQDRAIGSRPYAKMMNRLLSHVAAAAASLDDLSELPLLASREEKKIQLVIVSSDTGLAGAFNANLLRMAHRFILDRPQAAITVEAIGRKGRDYSRRNGISMTGEHIGIVDKPNYDQASAIARALIERYEKAGTDALYLIVNEFKSAMAPNLVLRRILPIELPESAEQRDYIFEEPPKDLLSRLLPLYVEQQIFRALLESNTAYNAARMTAMEAASSNARDMIDKLTLNMNRARQASITSQIIEIVSGAAAAV